MSKIKLLKRYLKDLGSVVIAYSGGLDSAFLLKAAVDTLGRSNVLAVTARSETYPHSEYEESRRIARLIGARQQTIHTSELGIKNFKSNPVNRCYYCKKELFKRLDGIRIKKGMNFLLDGANHDDLKDIRYGRKAALEIGVKSPLLESGMTKKDIRKYSKILKLPTWDKPSFACLASRFPFHSRISIKDLKRVSAAEEYIKGLGFRQTRVRIHEDIARVEIGVKDFRRFIELREKIIKKLKSLRFVYITLDLAGYRTGSMHEAGILTK